MCSTMLLLRSWAGFLRSLKDLSPACSEQKWQYNITPHLGKIQDIFVHKFHSLLLECQSKNSSSVSDYWLFKLYVFLAHPMSYNQSLLMQKYLAWAQQFQSIPLTTLCWAKLPLLSYFLYSSLPLCLTSLTFSFIMPGQKKSWNNNAEMRRSVLDLFP